MASPVVLIDDARVNAAVSWVLVAFLLFATLESLLSGALLWAGLAAVTVALTLLPPALSRDPTVMVSWEVVLLATVPLLGRSFGLLTQVATYLAVAALALLIAVEIHAFSSAEMTPRFAVAFVVITTMALAGVWAIARFFSDAYLSTSFLTGQTALMWDLVLATVVGLGAGLLFELYFRRYGPAGSRPDGLPGGEAS